jgi:hypothetical protein
MKPRATMLVLLTWPMLGCGLVLNGTSQTVFVRSEPPGAEVRTGPGELQYWTPARIQLPRKREYQLTFELAGYQPATLVLRHRIVPHVVALDVVATAGVGLIIDGLTGAWYRLEPQTARVTLAPAPSKVVVRLDPVEITLGIQTNDTITIRSSTPGVRILVSAVP